MVISSKAPQIQEKRRPELDLEELAVLAAGCEYSDDGLHGALRMGPLQPLLRGDKMSGSCLLQLPPGRGECAHHPANRITASVYREDRAGPIGVKHLLAVFVNN